MSIVLDIIIVLIISLTVFFAAKQGFVKTFLGMITFFLAIIIAIVCTSPVKEAFLKTDIAENVRDRVEESISDLLVADGTQANTDVLFSDDSKYASLVEITDSFGVDINKLKVNYDTWKNEGVTNLKHKIVSYIAEPAMNAIATVLAFFTVFIVAYIILKLLALVLDVIAKLPVLKQLNTALGVVIGVVLALVRTYTFCALIGYLLPYAASYDVRILEKIDVSKTFIFEFFASNNLLIEYLNKFLN